MFYLLILKAYIVIVLTCLLLLFICCFCFSCYAFFLVEKGQRCMYRLIYARTSPKDFVHFLIYCPGQFAHCHSHLPQLPLSAPMYIFLTYLSLIDASLTSVTTPKIYIDFIYQRRTIFLGGCLILFFVEHFLGTLRSFSSLSCPMNTMWSSSGPYTT